MKKYFRCLTISFLFLQGIEAQGQPVTNPADNIPVTEPAIPVVPVPYPALENITGQSLFNYIRVRVPDEARQSLPSSNFYYRQTTDYFDGLGRPWQTVAMRAHKNGNDIVKHHVYDAIGREIYQYLPYAAPTALLSPLVTGKFRLAVKDELRGFYDEAGPDQQPYSRTDFDNSPLNRTVKQLSTGQSWVGSERGVSYNQETNVAGEVMIWHIGSQSNALPVVTGTYLPGELYITRTTDEDGKYTKEFKDKNGNVVLKKVFESPVYEYGHTGFACTYYVYDDLQKLRYVIPPQAVYNMPVGWDVSGLTAFCYSYYYDERGRLVEKKIPGKALEEYVYDKRDRLIFSRDGNLKAQSKWAFTLYDALDRPITTGLIGFTSPRDVLQGLVNDDGYQYPAPDIWGYLKNFALYHFYPVQINAATILSYTYYDDYEQLGSFSYDYSQFNNNLPTGTQPYLVAPPAGRSMLTEGLVTGTRLRVKDPEYPNVVGWLTSVNYYDDNGRMIQSQSDNMRGGRDINSNIYYFQGMLWKTIAIHQNPSAQPVPGANNALTEHKVVTTYEVGLRTDGGNDQVRKVTQQINNGPVFNLANYNYDHMGRVTLKDLRAGLVLRAYNIRGLLDSIDAEDHSEIPFRPIFEEHLHYDKGFASKLYNGNIAGITWSGSDNRKNAYGYTYDKLNRLTHAEFRHEDGPQWSKTLEDYTASNISYDLNGNIQTMNQRGRDPLVATPAINIDVLSYTYMPNSNQLLRVEDQGTTAPSFPDFENAANLSEEYSYDANGNMISDANKKITSITYNHLNKPEIITTNEGSIVYIYDASGNRLQKKINRSGGTNVTDYMGNFVYENDILQYILNDEGRARPVANAGTNGETRFIYDYFIKDHLDNVRSTVTANPIDASYLARHELALANVEQLLFDNIPNVREGKPGTIDPNDGMAARLVAEDGDRRIGTAIMLKVMPGDKFTIDAQAFYEGGLTTTETIGSNDLINSLASVLMGGNTYAGVPIAELPENVQTVAQIFSNPSLLPQLEKVETKNFDATAPKAHLNYLFFDNHMNLVPDLSGKIQVQTNTGGVGTWQPVSPGGTTGTQICNCTPVGPGTVGIVLIYVDNQSIGKEVWFDDVHVEHYTSEVLSEDHYYPFGLTVQTMNAGSNNTAQPYKFGTKELEQSFGLEYYDYGARMYDPQLGVWHTIDPLAEVSRSWSPYNYTLGNPIRYIDPDGRKWQTANDETYSTTLQQNLSSRIETEDRNLQKANDRVSSLKEQITKEGASDKLNSKLTDANAKVASISTTISDLTNSVNEIAQMGNSAEQTFTFDAAPTGSSIAYTEKKGDGVIHIGYLNDANAVHESVHGYQIWKGTMSSNILDREVLAYQRQYSFDPGSMSPTGAPSNYGRINSRSDIKQDWILFLHDNNSVYPYMPNKNPTPSRVNEILKMIKTK